MLGVIKALTDVGNYIKELKTYFGLKNQTLFTGTWTTGTKTITNISKYQTVKVYTWEGYNGVLLERVSNTRIRGEGMVQGISSNTVHTSVGIDLICDSDQVTLQLSEYMHHTGNSSHGAATAINILKIVGVDPIIPQTLTKLGGGIDTVRGWLYAISKTMLDGYRKFCGYVNRYTTGLSQSWKTFNSMGKYFDDDSFWEHCSKQIYRFSSRIFTYSCCVWTMYLRHKLFGFVQYHNTHYFNNSFFDGVQEQLCDKVYDSGCLDRNRQSIASDWGCYCA